MRVFIHYHVAVVYYTICSEYWGSQSIYTLRYNYIDHCPILNIQWIGNVHKHRATLNWNWTEWQSHRPFGSDIFFRLLHWLVVWASIYYLFSQTNAAPITYKPIYGCVATESSIRISRCPSPSSSSLVKASIDTRYCSVAHLYNVQLSFCTFRHKQVPALIAQWSFAACTTRAHIQMI